MLEGKDIVACVAIAVSGLLIYMGHDGAIITFLGTIIGWYFGTKRSEKEA
jgi:hypothetical protein